MEPFSTVRQVMVWHCMRPADESMSKRKRMYYAAFTLFEIIVVLIGTLATGTFFLRYLSLYALFQLVAELEIINLLIVGLIHRHRIAAIFTELEKIYIKNIIENSNICLISLVNG